MARQRDALQFLAFVRRVIRAGGVRVGNEGDEFELGELVAIRDLLEETIAEAVKLQRQNGKSWQSIGDALELSRQGAQQRYGRRVA